MYVREFLKRYVTDWLSLLFGPLALVFTTYGVYVSKATYNRLLFTGLLVLGLVISSYRVWKKEYSRLLDAEFPTVLYPGGATEFAILDQGRILAEYVVAENLTVTNRSPDKPVNVNMYVQISRGSTHLMFSPENQPMPNWRELAHMRDVPNTNQLTFPLTIPPRTTFGGHAIFLLSRNMRYGVVEQGAQDEWFINVEEITTGTNRVFPINVVSRNRPEGGMELVYARPA